jgi:hypothetical protein
MTKARDRVASASAALCLQAIFAALVLYSLPVFSPAKKLSHELILVLPRQAPAPERRVPRRMDRPAPRGLAPVPAAPPVFVPATAPAPSDLQQLGKQLFGCAPENIDRLSPEDRAGCASARAAAKRPPDADLLGAPSHVQDESRWAAEVARKTSPPWLPCTTTITTPVGVAAGFNFGCLAAKFADGTLTDPHAWPIYQTKQLTPNDLYKIDQAYDAWNKDHAPRR